LILKPQEAREVEWEVLPPEQEANRISLEPLFRWVAVIMDGLVRLPGTKFRFGLNPFIDFIPVVGDVSAAFVSTSVLLYAFKRGMPKIVLARMALNVLINELVGIVPVVGSVFAFWFRANARNYELLQRHITVPVQPRKSDWIFVTVVLGLLLAVISIGLITTIFILRAFFVLLNSH
jgi:hypothetical protein